jgi:hypothetical protein
LIIQGKREGANMLRQMLEQQVTDEEFRMICDIATEDIRANLTQFGKRAFMPYVLYVMETILNIIRTRI